MYWRHASWKAEGHLKTCQGNKTIDICLTSQVEGKDSTTCAYKPYKQHLLLKLRNISTSQVFVGPPYPLIHPLIFLSFEPFLALYLFLCLMSGDPPQNA